MNIRRARLRLGSLAVLSLVSGALPWILGGSLMVALLGTPFLLLGLFCTYATYRLPRVAAAYQRRQYPLLQPGCPCGGNCGCGAGSATPAPDADRNGS